MMTSILALAVMGIGFNTNQETQLDLEIRGASLASVCEQIGTKMGWDMQVDPTIASEVLVIRTRGKQSNEVIAQIAEVTGTRWTPNGSQMLVQPDFDARNRELAKARSKNSATIIKAKADFLNGLKPQTYKDEEGEDYTYEAGPDRKLLGEMLAGLTDQFITSLAPGQRIVLSSNPTPMQRPLGRFNGQAITNWIATENEGRTISNEERAAMMNDPEYQQFMQMMGQNMEDMMPKPITETPQKVLLVVERMGRTEYEPPYIHIVLKVQGQGGKTLLSTEATLAPNGDYGAFGAMSETIAVAVESGIPIPGQEGEDPEPRKPLPGDEIKLSISEDVKEVFDATNVDFENPLSLKMSNRARELMMKVDVYEPMRYELGEFIFEAAEKLDKNLIAQLPDRMQRYGNKLPEKFGEVRDNFAAYEIEESNSGDYWRILPKELGKSWASRIDRKSLAATLSEAQNRMFLSLDTVSTFKYRFPYASRNPISAHRLSIFAPQMEGFMMGQSSESLLRLYGAMSVAERQTLRTSGSIQIGRLSSSARGVLQEMFFGYGANLESVNVEKDLNPGDPASMFGDMMGMGAMFMGGGLQTTEPTDAMPNGLPGNGVVSMKVDSETYLLAMSKEGTLTPGIPPIGRLELAMVSMMMKNPEFLAEMDQYAEILRNLRAGRRDNLRIAVLTAPSLGAKGVLTDSGDPDLTQVYSLQNLPSGLQQQMDADRKALEASPMGKFFEMMGGAGFGAPGGTIRP